MTILSYKSQLDRETIPYKPLSEHKVKCMSEWTGKGKFHTYPNAFVIETTKSKLFHCAAPTPEAKVQWMNSISLHSKEPIPVPKPVEVIETEPVVSEKPVPSTSDALFKPTDAIQDQEWVEYSEKTTFQPIQQENPSDLVLEHDIVGSSRLSDDFDQHLQLNYTTQERFEEQSDDSLRQSQLSHQAQVEKWKREQRRQNKKALGAAEEKSYASRRQSLSDEEEEESYVSRRGRKKRVERRRSSDEEEISSRRSKKGVSRRRRSLKQRSSDEEEVPSRRRAKDPKKKKKKKKKKREASPPVPQVRQKQHQQIVVYGPPAPPAPVPTVNLLPDIEEF